MISYPQESFQIGASAKATPLMPPPSLLGPCAPRIRAPFQVSSMLQCGPLQPPARPALAALRSGEDSIAAPVHERSQVLSLSHQFHRIQSNNFVCLPAPGFQRPAPSSFTAPSSVTDGTVSQGLQQESMESVRIASKKFSHMQHGSASIPAEPHISRVKLAATSSVVIKLWVNFELAFAPYSLTLQQMQSSLNCEEHRNRFLNQFAATTLIRYMTAALQFFRLCQELHLDFSSLSAWNIADVLTAGSMARRSDGSGPKTSIKAMRWCHRQLQISLFQEVFNPLISSFDKQKFPTDRRESLPMPLYVVMRWERRILQSYSTIQEIVILGGLLCLLWSGLRFGDIQRSHLATWQLDGSALRGLTWRSKTSNSATPFGICVSGLLSKGTLAWIHRYLQTLDELSAH